jgi:hypothetical protein
MVQSVTSEWYPGKSLEPHHIKLIRKLFVDCGESNVEKLIRSVINTIVNDYIYLGRYINRINNQMYSFSYQTPEIFSFELPAEEPMDVSDLVITISVVFQSNQSNTMSSCVIDKIPTDDEVQITNDNNPNRVPNPEVNKDLTRIVVVGPYTFRQLDEPALLFNEFLDDQMIFAYYKTLTVRSAIRMTLYRHNCLLIIEVSPILR